MLPIKRAKKDVSDKAEVNAVNITNNVEIKIEVKTEDMDLFSVTNIDASLLNHDTLKIETDDVDFDRVHIKDEEKDEFDCEIIEQEIPNKVTGRSVGNSQEVTFNLSEGFVDLPEKVYVSRNPKTNVESVFFKMGQKHQTYEKLIYHLENDDSDLDILSEDDDKWEIESRQQESEFTVSVDVQDQVYIEEGASDSMQIGVEIEEPGNKIVNPQVSSKTKQTERDSKTRRINLYYLENELTHEKDIAWRKNVQYLTPNIKWFHPMTIHLAELESPLCFFRRYFTPDLFNLMAENTNLYGIQQHARFSPTNPAELETFVALHILMGNLNYPQVHCYWDSKLRIPMIADSMARNRFFKLRENLHFVNVQEKPPNCTDRLWKVRPLYDTLRGRLLELSLETDLCVGEQMVPFKGQTNINHHIKGKHSPLGIKLFALCGTSGTMYDFVIYQGPTTELNPDQLEVFGLGASVVLKLSERIKEKNVRVYFDSYFSSYNLLQYLRSKNIYVAGTARLERFQKPPFSNDLDMKKRGRGTAEELISGDGVVVTKWFDSKPVIMASNYMGIGSTDQWRKWDKLSKEYIIVPRPEVVRNFNVKMGGVDKLEFLITLYRTTIRSRRWTLRMFTHAIDLACANGWLEYKSKALGVEKKDIMDLLHFRAYIAEALIRTNQDSTKKQQRRSSCSTQSTSPAVNTKNGRQEVQPVDDVRLDGYNHLPIFDDKKFSSRCKFPKCKSRTHYTCQKCNVHLCIAKKQDCFFLYHTKK